MEGKQIPNPPVPGGQGCGGVNPKLQVLCLCCGTTMYYAVYIFVLCRFFFLLNHRHFQLFILK